MIAYLIFARGDAASVAASAGTVSVDGSCSTATPPGAAAVVLHLVADVVPVSANG
jgi:hypothetical protein